MSNFPYPELKSFVEKYNAILSKAQNTAIFVRGNEFQQEQVKELVNLLIDIELKKKEAINEKNNTKSNLLLCLELTTNAVKNELLMLINLKEDNPDNAWQALIEAQREIVLAIRNHPINGDYLNGYSQRLHLYEITLFPKMHYASMGCVVSKSTCSICNEPIDCCEHIQGYAYMGQICCEIVQKIESIDEISLVENPADKSCRIMSLNENGKSIDIFTHREIKKEKDYL